MNTEFITNSEPWDSKKEAVKRFKKDSIRIDLQEQVLTGINRNPNLIEDRGFRIQGFRSGITAYKLMMYEAGITPQNILNGIKGLKAAGQDFEGMRIAIEAGKGLLRTRRTEEYELQESNQSSGKLSIDEILKIKPA